MSLITMKEILKESIEKKYAVGAFDTMDRVFTEAILNAALCGGTGGRSVYELSG